MKQLLRMLTVLCAAAVSLSGVLTASAAIPKSLTFKQVSQAPVFDGKIDGSYGDKIFEFAAKEIQVGDYNLYPRTPEELDVVKGAYNAMTAKGYAVFDNDNLYLAFDVTDLAPRAAANSAHFSRTTNVQLVFYVNDYLSFQTIAYTGKNSVRVYDDDGHRSEADASLMEAKLTENSKTNYVYEIKIPWKAFEEVNSLKDVTDIRMGFVQTSMAIDYTCAAFGEAYDLDYDRLLPVTLDKSSTASNSNTKKTASQSQKSSSGVDFGEDTTSSVTNSNQNATSADTGEKTGSNASELEQQTESNAEEIASDTMEQAELNSDKDTSDSQETQTNTASKKDYTLVIILSIIGAVVVIGGVIAIILLNKKSE